MEIRNWATEGTPTLESLFVAAFTASEGEGEGVLVGALVRELIATTDPRDLYGFVAVEGDRVAGAVFFSRLTCDHPGEVFLLSPMAVDTEYQGRGIGQELIHHGLQVLKDAGVSVVTTYGDPAFYARAGFEPLSPDTIRPPYWLSQPEGWLGQSLKGEPIEPAGGRCRCVKALDDPAYW